MARSARAPHGQGASGCPAPRAPGMRLGGDGPGRVTPKVPEPLPDRRARLFPLGRDGVRVSDESDLVHPDRVVPGGSVLPHEGPLPRRNPNLDLFPSICLCDPNRHCLKADIGHPSRTPRAPTLQYGLHDAEPESTTGCYLGVEPYIPFPDVQREAELASFVTIWNKQSASVSYPRNRERSPSFDRKAASVGRFLRVTSRR